jgi:hypothetical protein
VQEVRLIEGRHLRLDRRRAELPPAVANSKKRWRIIYLTLAAERILTRLFTRHPSGSPFRNADGNRWDAQAFNNRFYRLQACLGRGGLERRGWSLDPAEVAAFAATLVLIDETGLFLHPLARRGCSPVGRTPMVGGDGGHRKKASVIGAVSVPPVARRPGFCFPTGAGGDFSAEGVVASLRGLLTHSRGEAAGA